MDKFSILQGRTYELGGLSGAIGALRGFRLSETAESQVARITSQLGNFNLPGICHQVSEQLDMSLFPPESLKSSFSVLSARLFQGYVQGFCETKQFVKSLPCRGKPVIAWVYANPLLHSNPHEIPAMALKELSKIADLSDFNPLLLKETGTCPFADFLFIIRTYHHHAYHFHLVCYELSTHNTPTLETELNLTDPDDIYESLRRGKDMMSNVLRTRDFRIASETLGLEISPELKHYFQGLLSHDKIAKKLFQGGGYLYSLYETLKNRVKPVKPFDKWKSGKGNIEFHIVAFTDRGRHFLHIREDESAILKEMGHIYKGIKIGRYETPAEKKRLREKEIRDTHIAILRNIWRNTSPELRKSLNAMYARTKETLRTKSPLPDFLKYTFTEEIKGYCPTGTPPTKEMLKSWLPDDVADSLNLANIKSMQDAHAKVVKLLWHSDDIDIYVLSGTPGIGKTTALRNILAKYPCGYLLVYISPRLQVNTDLMAKFDPTNEHNGLVGDSELICLSTNASLIRAAGCHYGISALSCRCQKLPNDSKFLFLSPEDAEELECKNLADVSSLPNCKFGTPRYKLSGTNNGSEVIEDPLPNCKFGTPRYKRTKKGGAGDGKGYYIPGVFNTMMQAIHRLNITYNYKRIIACATTQSNRQLKNGTTVSTHLDKIFGDTREFDIESVKKFSKNIKELIFFIDEVTGDRAGRQTAQEIIAFKKEVEQKFEERGIPCPLKFRIIIADASLINATSVESFLNKEKPQPDQILFSGNADSKGLSIEETKIMNLPAKIINANVYPASSLTLKWRLVLDYWCKGDPKITLAKKYHDLEKQLLRELACELVCRWQEKPEEQTIVIIQNKKSLDSLNSLLAVGSLLLAGNNPRANTQELLPNTKHQTPNTKHQILNTKHQTPTIITLHSYSPSDLKRELVSPASKQEKAEKRRIASVSQKGDLADIILMTSSGTRGLSFPNATKIICIVPTFSMENNFMEFLQGIYRGRGSGKGNQLDREIEIILPQMLADFPENLQETQNPEELKPVHLSQISNLFATQMIMRMSILTRIFGASDLFGKLVSCIPISGNLVQGALQTTMDDISSAIRALEYAYQQDKGNTELRYITENTPDIFKNETVILSHIASNPTAGNRNSWSKTLISEEYRKRMLRQFTQDANKGLDKIATGDYIPENCYTIGELILQDLDAFKDELIEKNTHLIETHLKETNTKLKAICAKLNHLIKDPNTARGIRDPANTLYSVLNVLANDSENTDIESEIKGPLQNRWLILPISAMQIDKFWKDQADPTQFKAEMKKIMEDYFHTYLCRPHHILPLTGDYNDNSPPWLLARGPEIAQQLDARFQTRYFVSSGSLALLNILLLSKHSGP